MNINQFDNSELQRVLDHLVPLDSPYCIKVQNLIINTLYINSGFCLHSSEQTNIDMPVFASSECGAIAKIVVKEKKIEDWAVTYMLVLFYQRYGQARSDSEAWQFMSAYLQIIIMISIRKDDHSAKVNQLSVRLRMGLKDNNPQFEIVKKLINIHAQHVSLTKALALLRQYEAQIRNDEDSGKVVNQKLAGKIGQIRLAYEVVAENKAFVGKTYTNSQNNELSKEHTNKRYLDSSDEPVRFTIFGKPHKNDNVADAENTADDDPPALLDNDFKPSRTTAKSSELQQWKLKNNYRHARRNKFHFPTNLRQLSLLSYQMLFARVWQVFTIVSYKQRQVYAVILLSLLSGRKIQDVIYELELDNSQRKWLSHESGSAADSYAISNTIDVTSNRRSHLLPHRQSHDSEFKLPLPARLQAVIENKFLVNSNEVSEVLASLKMQLDLPVLSNQHIDACLYTVIKNELQEPLHADMITGIDVKHSSPLYYTSIETISLEKTYYSAIQLLTEYCSVDSQNELRQLSMSSTKSNRYKKHIGSDMTLNTDICQKFFDELAEAAESYNGRLKRNLSIRQDRYIEQFNAYGVWLWHIIFIQTGIRPVKHAPGLLNQFDFRQRLLWVSDKEERHGQGQGRLIPLSDFLITAIQNYIEYIKQFAVMHNSIYPNDQFPINNILNSSQPLIQLFSQNPKGFAGITPSKVRYQIKHFFSHQDNWLRHQLRSLLTNRSPEHLICALYGHEHPDQEAMHPMSSLSINELKELSCDLDKVAGKLNLRQIEVNIYG
ncbi:hypothetical protein QL919_11850 [Psychrobacter sp. APC 3426]|uniref:hypothetical protein n=1 Tax=Psychrobacter sp. APC 3426 TaxID=3035177 RepID=UPI0025B2AC6E|nr:hypothetical protein [Psychrobacter sp. APC 3426]MDN3399419.1 hypothetical protein [Psychrobacter sp. APC 3426]